MRGLLAPLVKLSIFLVVTIAATYLLAVTIANKNSGSTTSYKAIFTDVTSLNVGDDVRIAGVRVGSVTGLKIVNHNQAQVSFSVAKSRSLPKSTIAKIRYRNLIGQRFLEIDNGAGDPNDLLKAHQTIPASQTQNALDLTALFGGFQPLFQGLNPTEINSLSLSVIQTLQGEGGTIQLLLQQVGDVTNALADKDQIIGELIDNLNSLLTTVAQRDTELGDLVDQLQRFVSGLSADRTTIGNSIDSINALAASTTDLLIQSRPPLKADVVALTNLAGLLNKNSGDLASAIQTTPLIAGELTRTASYGSWFNFYLCQVTAATGINLPVVGTVLNPNYPLGGGARCAGTS
jgi:phospholipid/cholesterol/gamma-HCH transport system substrate-binding protein